MFNIITDKLIEDLLSPRLRTDVIIRFLRSIFAPIKTLVTHLNSFRNETTLKLSYNAQVCSIERLLNDRFDNVLRRITIGDMASVNMLVAYENEYLDERIIVADAADFEQYPVIVYDYVEVGDNTHRFIINIPDEVQLHNIEAQLIALTNRYKFAGKTFRLRYF